MMAVFISRCDSSLCIGFACARTADKNKCPDSEREESDACCRQESCTQVIVTGAVVVLNSWSLLLGLLFN